MPASATCALYLVDCAPSRLFRHSPPINASAFCKSSSNFSSRSWCYKQLNTSGLTIGKGFESRLRGTSAMTQSSYDQAVEDKLGIKVERNPSEDRISTLGIKSWPKWGCPPSKFPWTYDATETCYLLKGKVKVYPEGSSEYVEIGAGDLVVFPKGMSCSWDVLSAVDKHYTFS